MNRKVDNFLEENNMDFLYLILAGLEAKRLENLPIEVKDKFKQKMTDMSLQHVADNYIPDYAAEVEKEIFSED
ncbi:MAG: hypothetical protein U9N34_09725 [Candidatus Cloacimonadota bacterium]|nr:hypothetical protein [Candidatus Cloacimonadota bacterium]